MNSRSQLHLWQKNDYNGTVMHKWINSLLAIVTVSLKAVGKLYISVTQV